MVTHSADQDVLRYEVKPNLLSDEERELVRRRSEK